MEVSLPDPITNYNRQQIRRRYQRREEYILGHHPGFNLLYWRRIIRARPASNVGAGASDGPRQIMYQGLLI
jgi:hypothetical protein